MSTVFCRWLAARLGYHVRLPGQAEWQLAATGNDRRNTYPWGPLWRPQCSNSRDSGLKRTVAVGMYPCGAAPCGALDMAGNVCEWTASNAPEHGKRVLRGGAWCLSPSEARAAARLPSFAYERVNYFGFRLAAAFVPESGRAT